MALVPGLYDQLVDRALAARIERQREDARTSPLDAADAPLVLSQTLARRFEAALRSLKGKPAEVLAAQVALTNEMLAGLQARAEDVVLAQDQVQTPGEKLVAVLEPARTGLEARAPLAGPVLPLGQSDLLVNGRHDLSVGTEIDKEIASADRVDLLCAFLKWSGFRLVEGSLRRLLEARPGAVRVLTTAYMGATERRALDELARMGADVRVSFDTTHTRLHAKAWLFHRDTGFDTGFIGSSNLSAAAMLDGLEWNVRLSKVDNAPILRKFAAVFEQYWASSDFLPYDPDEHADLYDEAVRRQRTQRNQLITAFDIRPRPHQEEILDALDVERAHGHTRNLVVAATGTGKTVIAALDYRRLKKALGAASLLFVAHRAEILEQSLTTFQVVLKDAAFGERLGAGETPRAGEHVFASVQSLHAERLAAIPPDAFDVVIVDEFHHAAAPTYARLLEHLRPRYLIGLTATPERSDGRSVLHWFDHRIAAELRLWKALDQGLLCPFQYFGVAGPDLSAVSWRRGRYDTSELRNVLTADDFQIKRILQAVHDKVADPSSMRALGFCVDVAHAEFMARHFDAAGLAAEAVSGATPASERRAALDRLKQGSLRVLFSVDLFNEGVDLPNVDTLLLLRPTESPTLFLQQLGRGLRPDEDKDCLTVLDFIGAAHRSFRYDLRFRALLGGTRKGLQRQIEAGFPQLPSGCAIRLDRVAQQAVLDNVQRALRLGTQGLVSDLRALGDVPLSEFLRETGVELEDVYARPGHCFTALRRAAGLVEGDEDATTRRIASGLGRMLHLDDDDRIQRLRALVSPPRPPEADADDPTQRALYALLGFIREPYAEMGAAWAALWSSPLRTELRQLLGVLEDRRRTRTSPLGGPLAKLPLAVHATYTLDEILASADQRTKTGGLKRIQTGVYPLKAWRTDLLFVTLDKSERDYSPTTLYRDYPVSDRRFHWESQSSCHEDTPTGRRYQRVRAGGDDRALLFVRERRKDARGVTMPYVLLGEVSYVSHSGGRPMQIMWALEHAIPAAYYQEIKLAAG